MTNTPFTIFTDHSPRYYASALEAVIRFAEAQESCYSRCSVYINNKLVARYLSSTEETEYIIPQQEWFNL